MINNAKDVQLIAELLRSKLDENGELRLPKEKAFALINWVESAAKSQEDVAALVNDLIELREKIKGNFL